MHLCKYIVFSNFSCMFLNPNNFSNLNSNCSCFLEGESQNLLLGYIPSYKVYFHSIF